MSEVPKIQTIRSKITSTTKQNDWVNIIKQWKLSGLSQPGYCKANNINYNQFVYQHGKLLVRTKEKSKLIPIKINQTEHAERVQNNFILHYPNGLKLQIPVNAHPEAIKTLLTCLEQTSC